MTSWSPQSVEEALGEHVTDPGQRAILGVIAPTLARLLNHEMSPVDAAHDLEQAQPMLEDLASRRVRAQREGAVIDFGAALVAGAQFGDVAGGDIVKIVLNLGGRPITIGERTPFHDIEHRIVRRIREVDPVVLDIAARELGVAAAAELPLPWAIARALLRADFDTLNRVVSAIAISMCEDIERLITLVAPFCWIQREAAARISSIRTRPPGQRGAGLNGRETTTGRAVVSCAPMPLDTYVVTEIEGGWGEDVVEHMRASITADLVRRRLCSDPARCIDELVTSERSVFVVVPPPPPAPAHLEAVRASFPALTFVLLAGNVDEPTFASFGLRDVEYLKPELAPGAEDEARSRAFRAMTTATLKCGDER
jgi:hypothetical protein